MELRRLEPAAEAKAAKPTPAAPVRPKEVLARAAAYLAKSSSVSTPAARSLPQPAPKPTLKRRFAQPLTASRQAPRSILRSHPGHSQLKKSVHWNEEVQIREIPNRFQLEKLMRKPEVCGVDDDDFDPFLDIALYPDD
jgi:hypothetical protein